MSSKNLTRIIGSHISNISRKMFNILISKKTHISANYTLSHQHQGPNINHRTPSNRPIIPNDLHFEQVREKNHRKTPRRNIARIFRWKNKSVAGRCWGCGKKHAKVRHAWNNPESHPFSWGSSVPASRRRGTHAVPPRGPVGLVSAPPCDLWDTCLLIFIYFFIYFTRIFAQHAHRLV